jgi:hypothetical protein
MKASPQIFRIGALGAGFSTLMLIGMAFIALPRGMSYPGLEALTGQLMLSGAEQAQYFNGMRLIFVLDGIFLAGWLLSWVGLSTLVRSRLPLFGLLTLFFGLAGALCDFTENSIIWGVLQQYSAGLLNESTWVIFWKAVQHISYWLPFLGAVFAACGLWSKNTLDKITALCGTVLVIPAILGLYFPALAMLANAWFLIWFAVVAILLWRRADEFIPL